MKSDLNTPTAQNLLGVWNLVRWEITYDDGRPTTYPFGPDATGLIQYTPVSYTHLTLPTILRV